MKKILYIFDVDPMIAGGAQNSMNIIIDSLKDEFEFFCITPETEAEYKRHYKIYDYSDFFIRKDIKSLYKLFKLAFSFRKAIDEIQPDIIHIQMPGSIMILSIMVRLGLINKKIKLIYTDRSVLDKYSKKSYLLIGNLINRLDKIITTTEYNRELYLKNFKINNSKVDVISNTAGHIYEIYDIELKKKLRKRHNIADNEMVLGFYGRVFKDKNWPLSIEVIEKLRKLYKFKVVLVLGTDGTKENNYECNQIIESVKKINGEENVKVFKNLSLEETSYIYYLSDITIMTSSIESFGRVAVEGMSRKNIVFGTKVDGLQEVIGEEENLFYTSDELVTKIEKYFKNNYECISQKEKCYKRFKEKYSLEKNKYLHSILYTEI